MKYSFWKLYILVFFVWFTDFFTSVLVFTFSDNFSEASKLPAYFFSFGLIGYISWFFIYLLISLLAIYLPPLIVSKIYEFAAKKPFPNSFKILLQICLAVGYMWAHLEAIISNMILWISVGL